jgi:hypothetical protein
MSEPFSVQVPAQRPSLQLAADAPASMQRRVRFVVLLQLAEHGYADLATTTAICPPTDERDLEAALEHLLQEGSIAGDTWRLEPLVTLAENGNLALTTLGRRRIDEDDV